MDYAQTHVEGGTKLPRERQQLHEEHVHHPQDPGHIAAEHHDERKKSLGDRLHLTHHHKEGEDKDKKRDSISESGPYITERNPETGHLITRPNPHWPDEDSWKRENVRSGKGDDKTIAPGGFGVSMW